MIARYLVLFCLLSSCVGCAANNAKAPPPIDQAPIKQEDGGAPPPPPPRSTDGESENANGRQSTTRPVAPATPPH